MGASCNFKKNKPPSLRKRSPTKKKKQSSLLDLNQRLNTHLIQLEPTKTTWRGPPTMPHSTSTYQVRLVPKVDDGCFHWWGQIRCEFQGGNQGDLEKFQWDQNDLWKTQKKGKWSVLPILNTTWMVWRLLRSPPPGWLHLKNLWYGIQQLDSGNRKILRIL